MQENIKPTKTLISGILNAVNVFLCAVIAVAYIILLYSNVLGKGLDNDGTLGFVVILIVFVPLAIIAFVPIVIDSVYKIIFAIMLLTRVCKVKTEEVNPIKNGYYVASLVFKIISTVALALEAILIVVVISSGGLPWLGLTFAFAILAVIVLQIVLIFIEKSSRKEF